MDRRQAGDHGVLRGYAREEVAEAGERRPLTAVARVDQHAPVADGCQLRENRRRYLALLVVERPGLPVAADHFQRLLHRGVAGCRGRQLRRSEQVERYALVPDRSVNRTVHRLVLRREQGLDLLIRPIDSPRAPGFLLALAAE